MERSERAAATVAFEAQACADTASGDEEGCRRGRRRNGYAGSIVPPETAQLHETIVKLLEPGDQSLAQEVASCDATSSTRAGTEFCEEINSAAVAAVRDQERHDELTAQAKDLHRAMDEDRAKADMLDAAVDQERITTHAIPLEAESGLRAADVEHHHGLWRTNDYLQASKAEKQRADRQVEQLEAERRAHKEHADDHGELRWECCGMCDEASGEAHTRALRYRASDARDWEPRVVKLHELNSAGSARTCSQHSRSGRFLQVRRGTTSSTRAGAKDQGARGGSQRPCRGKRPHSHP